MSRRERSHFTSSLDLSIQVLLGAMYETATRSVDKLLRPFLYRALQIKQNLKKTPKLPGMRSEKSSFYSQVAMKYAKH